MLIGLLLAGQHTSSTTSAWMGFYLAKDKALQDRCYAEQKAVCGKHLPPLSFDQVPIEADIHEELEYNYLQYKLACALI